MYIVTKRKQIIKTITMTKEKSPKEVSVNIDGVDVNVPVLVDKLIKGQRDNVHYLEHVLCLWHYKHFTPNKDDISKDKSDYQNELAEFVEAYIPTMNDRIDSFKKADAEMKENSKETVDSTDIN